MKRRKLSAVVLALATIVALGLTSCSGSSSNGKYFHFSSGTKLGTLIPVNDRKPPQPITGTLLSGGSTTVGAKAGTVTLLNFWASWCGPCRVESPVLSTYYQQVKSTGVDFIGVDSNDSKSGGRQFVTQQKISYPSIFDQLGRVAGKLGNIPGLPFTVLLDKQNRVAAVYLGQLTTVDLERPLAQLRAGH